jgi:lipoprotein-releasing system permease protein
MNLINKIAFRYFTGSGSANAIPILSRISMVAVGVCAAAMIILFSVFNGFESLVKDSYKAFYPDIKITKIKGKFFTIPAEKLAAITRVNGVSVITSVIEDNVLAKDDNLGGKTNGNDNQLVLTLLGVDSNYFIVNNIHGNFLNGVDTVSQFTPYTCIVGERIMKELGLDINNIFSYVLFYYLDPTVVNPEADPDAAFQTLKAHPAGAFSVLEEFDSKYIFANIGLVQKLFHAEGKYSSVEIAAKGEGIDRLKANISEILGKDFSVATRFEQNKTMYMVMNTEKWAVYLILLMVLLIASFNMVGALTMLVLEKRKDMVILTAMGISGTSVFRIFLTEGVLWSVFGGIVGLLLGLGVCVAQQYFKLIRLGEGFIVDAYPVKINITDILIVLFTILFVGILAAWFPASKANKMAEPSLKTF